MRKGRLFYLIAGILLLSGFLLAAWQPELLTDYGLKEMFRPWLAPDGEHLLGTNALGYDIFTELVYGTRSTLLIGLTASLLTLVLGAGIGILAAQPGRSGSIFNGLVNLFVLLPRMVTLIVLSAFLGSSGMMRILLIAAFGWAATARVIRARTIQLLAEPFVENLVIQGFSRSHIALYHMLPNLGDILLSRFLLGVNSCIMLESTLSFLGFGDLYRPTWGTMINFAYQRGAFLRGAYHYLLAPGLCVMLLSLAFYFLSVYLEGCSSTIREGS